jgi:hypothetical protein
MAFAEKKSNLKIRPISKIDALGNEKNEWG